MMDGHTDQLIEDAAECRRLEAIRREIEASLARLPACWCGTCLICRKRRKRLAHLQALDPRR